MSSFWTLERDQRLRKLKASGMGSGEIAAELGTTIGAVWTRISNLKLATTKISPTVKERVLELGREGATPSRIGRRTGIDPTAVEVILQRAGIEVGALPSSYRGDDRRRASR